MQRTELICCDVVRDDVCVAEVSLASKKAVENPRGSKLSELVLFLNVRIIRVAKIPPSPEG